MTRSAWVIFTVLAEVAFGTGAGALGVTAASGDKSLGVGTQGIGAIDAAAGKGGLAAGTAGAGALGVNAASGGKTLGVGTGGIGAETRAAGGLLGHADPLRGLADYAAGGQLLDEGALPLGRPAVAAPRDDEGLEIRHGARVPGFGVGDNGGGRRFCCEGAFLGRMRGVHAVLHGFASSREKIAEAIARRSGGGYRP